MNTNTTHRTHGTVTVPAVHVLPTIAVAAYMDRETGAIRTASGDRVSDTIATTFRAYPTVMLAKRTDRPMYAPVAPAALARIAHAVDDATRVPFDVENTGGGYMVAVFTRFDGAAVVVTDEAAVLYATVAAFQYGADEMEAVDGDALEIAQTAIAWLDDDAYHAPVTLTADMARTMLANGWTN